MDVDRLRLPGVHIDVGGLDVVRFAGLMVAAGAFLAIAISGAPERAGAAGGPLCAYYDRDSVSGIVVTVSFHVVSDNCQVSFVSITKYADGNAIYDTATGVFAASETYATLSVTLPCGRNSETDLVLGPPSLYPPSDLDLGAKHWNVACPSSGGGGSSSGGGGSSGGGSAGGALPDLTATMVSSKLGAVRVGDAVDVTVTLANRGQGKADGVHLLITPSVNLIQTGATVQSGGQGCSGVAVIDCDFGTVAPGAEVTARLRLKAAGGPTFFVSATPQRIQADATPGNDVGTLNLKVIPRPVRFAISAKAGRRIANEQFVLIKLTSGGRALAQVYYRGIPQRIVWRRTLGAGTSPVRIPIPTAITKGQRYTIVLRATRGTSKSSTVLRLIA